MNKYKVSFEGNKAVGVSVVNNETRDHLQIGHQGGKRFIKWFVVRAFNEDDALLLAESVVNETLLGIVA